MIGYLKQAPLCTHCGETLGRFGAEDAAPYFTTLIVGILVVPIILLLVFKFQLSALQFELVVVPLILAVTLILLPFVKGAFIGVLWSLDVHQ